MGARFSLERSLAADGISADSLAQALATGSRADIAHLPRGAAAYILFRHAARTDTPLCILTPDSESARSLRDNLNFFFEGHNNPGQVLYFPPADTTPFVEMASDRRASMDRLSCLFHLAHEMPMRCIVAPIQAALRKVPPANAVRARSQLLRVSEEIDTDTLATHLAQAGYMRVPVVEDPGTFAMRGSLVDLFPPQEAYPYRVELDFDTIVNIRRFDPDDQRSLGDAEQVALPPVRDTMVGPEELSRAVEQVRKLCDEKNIPTSKRKQLVSDIESGRHFPGVEAFSPAFYDGLGSLFEYVPNSTQFVVVDPSGCAGAADEELNRADRDYWARVDGNKPSYNVADHYLNIQELERRLVRGPLTLLHRLAVGGRDFQSDCPPSSLSELCTVDSETVLRGIATDQLDLQAELKTKRSDKTSHKPLLPLATHVERWLSEGMRVLLCARTTTQAQRLSSLLGGYGIDLEKPEVFTTQLLERRDPFAQVVTGSLMNGVVLPHENLVLVTEEEIFGHRQHQTSSARRKRTKKRAFVEDLRQLSAGDYIVHAEHGIGIYQGLQHKTVPISRYEELQGKKPSRVEVLVVEYAGGDKLFLPVTRLNQIEKFSGAESKSPKLDKLGGQTFSRKKSKVEHSVRQLADELLTLYAARAARKRPQYPAPDELFAELEATFAFDETEDQARAIEDVLGDMASEQPMDRLICGDVGFGKTEVALRAAFRAALAGRQVAVLCPTTVLAQQHLRTFQKRLRDFPVSLSLLSRFVSKKEQTTTLNKLKGGDCDIIIGTHRLLSKDVHFKNLGLLIVDEEQRFGVAHKERIKKLRNEVDVLTLSATPIPRTLQMAIGGLRELSLITTPPVDRRAVRTFVTRWDEHTIREAIARERARGGQIYFIHNRIDRLHERAAQLQELVPDATIATIHGRMRADTLERVMADFVEGRYDILCATAIVENGLDIPRANTIIIDRADHLGLSQMYQLRGRVGRSRERAYCYLVTRSPNDMSDEARSRIEAIERYTQLGSGFQVASLDMEHRGAGDLLGAEQSGSVAAVGFDMFVHMLEEAVAELRGAPLDKGIDTELTITTEHFLPEEYVPDVGIRLSLYKRFAAAQSDEEIRALSLELEDRFGPPPAEAAAFVRVMELRPTLLELRALGCEASPTRVTLHLKQDCPLPSDKLLNLVRSDDRFSLTPDMKLTQRFDSQYGMDPIAHVQSLTAALQALAR